MDYKSNSESRLSSFLADPSKALWRLAVPIMFGLGIHTLYNVIDMIFIGQLGGNAIAGVASVSYTHLTLPTINSV